MDLNWRSPDRQGRTLYAAAGIASVGGALLLLAPLFDQTDMMRSLGIGFLVGALIVVASSLIVGRFLNRDD